MVKIALAIGHNFSKGDRGAAANWTTEANTTKKIIDTIIKKGIPGFTIVKCPEWLGIKERNKWVNSQKDLAAYFEFHLDSATPKATGVTTYFVWGNTWAQWEAKQFQMEYTRLTGLKGRGVHADTENRWWRLWAIRDIRIFGLLMELGFISNPNDLKVIQEKWVEAITSGIKTMFAS